MFDSSDPAAKPLAAELLRRELRAGGQHLAAGGDGGRGARGARLSRAGHAAARPAWRSFTSTAAACRSAVGDGSSSAIGRDARPLDASGSPTSSARTSCCGRSCRTRSFPRFVTWRARTSWRTWLSSAASTTAFGVPMPLMYQRATATLLDSNAMRFLTRQTAARIAARAGRSGAERSCSRPQLPPSVEASLDEAVRAVGERMERLSRRGHCSSIPHSKGAARSALGRMQDDLKKLHGQDHPGGQAQGRDPAAPVQARAGAGVSRRPAAGARGRIRVLSEPVRPRR